MSPGLIVLLLSLLLGLQPVTTDLYLPALPALTEGFGASMAQAQLTLTALLLSFGLSQLVWGPLSCASKRPCPPPTGGACTRSHSQRPVYWGLFIGVRHRFPSD